MSSTQYRRRASDAVEVQVPRRYGNKVYFYSGEIDTVPVVGVDVSFLSVDEATEYELYVGYANTTDDFDVIVSINGVKIFGRVDSDITQSSISEIVKFIAPPHSTVTVKINQTSTRTVRKVTAVLVGTIIDTFSKN